MNDNPELISTIDDLPIIPAHPGDLSAWKGLVQDWAARFDAHHEAKRRAIDMLIEYQRHRRAAIGANP